MECIGALADVMVWKGVPEHLRSDNGPEFVAKYLRKLLADTEAKHCISNPALRLHSSLEYRPPAPKAWLTSTSWQQGEPVAALH